MADIATAPIYPEALDPQEILDFDFDLTDLLEDGEAANPGEWTLEIPIEGAGLGLVIMTGDGRDPSLRAGGKIIDYWVTVDDAMKNSPIFDGAGTTVPLRVTSPTTSTPQRIRQRTAKMRIVQQ